VRAFGASRAAVDSAAAAAAADPLGFADARGARLAGGWAGDWVGAVAGGSAAEVRARAFDVDEARTASTVDGGAGGVGSGVMALMAGLVAIDGWSKM